MSTKTPATLLSIPSKKWLLIMLLVVIAPHVAYIPLWLTSIALCIIGWIGISLFSQRPELPVWGRRLFVVGVIAGVLIYASMSQGLAGLSSLLIAGAILKVLELRTRRDGWVLILVACFIAAVSFLFDQSIVAATYGGVSLMTVFSALTMMHHPNEQRWFTFPLKKSALILLQSMPLMLILFLIFPRISPLWSIQYNNSVAKTGLSDDMEPGNISQLARSDSVAFRVSFSTGVPPASTDRYWRAMTYPIFDGQRWSMAQESIDKGINKRNSEEGKDLVEYQVIAEPSANSWLFALDYPSGVPSREILQFSDGTFQAGSPIYERLFYSAKADLSGAYDGRPLYDRARYLSVPKNGNPATRAMVAKWAATGFSPEQKIAALLQRFNEKFSYTLSPQKLRGDRIDQFLFTTQEGFCEHFSNATAFALRLGGIPTRVVAGYLGGEWNPYEKYMLVRQYEAHAWVEAWLDGKGWVRIDPTAAVAPERVILPFDQLFSDSPEFMSDNAFATYRMQQSLPWLKTWSLRYDALNYNWHRWVLGFHEEQSGLLQDWFGKISILKMLLLLFIPVGVALTVVIWILLRVPSHKINAVDQEVITVSAGLCSVAPLLQREAGETVTSYCQRVARSLPVLRSRLEDWSELYQQIRYVPESHQIEQNTILFLSCSRQLKKDIKRLKKQDFVRGSID
ncbi:transglutaminase TgpA family protein [Neptunomonas japonica]|uniref:transglutaminase TgpA family protein n=1 Tax=Neptunomonas japonica TaxID=417574 RepID=UPI000A0226F1|nr:DUF3488 and DUF4129 domain-containing transglutaminase family protein [Neptunomonas japonica]